MISNSLVPEGETLTGKPGLLNKDITVLVFKTSHPLNDNW